MLLKHITYASETWTIKNEEQTLKYECAKNGKDLLREKKTREEIKENKRRKEIYRGTEKRKSD